MQATRPATVARDRTLETPTNLRKPPTEGRFLSQKVVTNGAAGTSCCSDRRRRRILDAGHLFDLKKKRERINSPNTEAPSAKSDSGGFFPLRT